MKVGHTSVVAIAQWTIAIGLLALAEIAARYGLVDKLTIVPVAEIWKALVAGFASGRFLPQLASSGSLMLQAFVLSIVIGIPLGYMFSRIPRLYGWVRPYIESYYSLPIFVFYPVAVAMMGLSPFPALLIVWFWATGGVIVNTVIGFDRVPGSLEKYGRSIGLTEWQKLWRLRLPAARHSIMTGVKLGIVYSIAGTIGVEFILSSRGVGKLISYAFNDFKTAEMYALILIVLAFAAICHWVLTRLEALLERTRGHAIDHAEMPAELAGSARRKRGVQVLEILIVPAFILIIWQALASAVGPDKLAGPIAAAVALWEGLLDGSWPSEIGQTARDTAIAFLISALGGLVLGAIFGQFRLIRDIFGPWLTASFTVPKIVLYPILLFLFGLGATSRIAYGVLHAAPAIVLFTLAGMLAVAPGHVKYANSLQLSSWHRFRHIALPSAMPEILSGLRFGLGTCFLGVLVAEMLFGAGEGAGFAIVQAAIAADTPRLMALVVVVFALVLFANYLMARLRRIALPASDPGRARRSGGGAARAAPQGAAT